ncbi:hypothetical protein AVEN_171170-1 [Araneus ventricosus]|uniref:Tc1-like transposase DDE domain-containing protein n=1 Tax=Araneus ventricosus TaxID=182803 RepID=A0A4Y2FBG5_ARAVE|nr:hypothetical protein AVEN_171170-1 [Araneus ventricosus]
MDVMSGLLGSILLATVNSKNECERLLNWKFSVMSGLLGRLHHIHYELLLNWRFLSASKWLQKMNSPAVFIVREVHHKVFSEVECLEEDITCLKWSAFFPDLNPAEHVWRIFGDWLKHASPSHRSSPDLRVALMEEWN